MNSEELNAKQLQSRLTTFLESMYYRHKIINQSKQKANIPETRSLTESSGLIGSQDMKGPLRKDCKRRARLISCIPADCEEPEEASFWNCYFYRMSQRSRLEQQQQQKLRKMFIK